jgi:hypothetical protein
MPRARKAARSYRAPNQVALDQVREMFSDPMAIPDLMVWRRFFFAELPTPELRQAFAELYPQEYLDVFRCISHSHDKYPASVDYGSPFRRSWTFYQENPASVPFDPPDLRGVPYRDRQRIMAEARCQWWQANAWPMTAEEIHWLGTRGVERPSTPKVLSFGKKENTQ